jgi:hypothetical protein
MHIKFNNKDIIDVTIEDNPVAAKIHRMYKHLQYVDLKAMPWHNPFTKPINATDLIVKTAGLLNIDVDTAQFGEQSYLNYLHTLYETNYVTSPSENWLIFHELIHNLEGDSSKKDLIIDFLQSAGPVTCKFDLRWLEYKTLSVQPGQVYVKWAELGKIPFKYWRDNEPNDISRICELAKPWLTLRPKLHIALETVEAMTCEISSHSSEFLEWWEVYHSDWCNHWNIDQWLLDDMFCYIPIGKVDDLPRMKSLLSQGATISRVTQ